MNDIHVGTMVLFKDEEGVRESWAGYEHCDLWPVPGGGPPATLPDLVVGHMARVNDVTTYKNGFIVDGCVCGWPLAAIERIVSE